MIKSHKDLASAIKGKTVLHTNSLGKDSVVCLEWLARYSGAKRIVSIHLEPFAKTKWDDIYWAYLKKRYPNVEFYRMPSSIDLNNIINLYKNPVETLKLYNGFEYVEFDTNAVYDEVMEYFGADFISYGHSKYESVTRATFFHKKGLVDNDVIYPIGLMTKQMIKDVIKTSGLKLHPLYRFLKSTPDHPSWYKMRALCLVDEKYKKDIFKFYPLLALDKYRYERLFKKT